MSNINLSALAYSTSLLQAKLSHSINHPTHPIMTICHCGTCEDSLKAALRIYEQAPAQR